MRIPRPRWPSKDPRDYQTVGRLSAGRSRRSETANCVRRSGGAELSGLIRVVSIDREQALLHVELHAHCAALDRRLAVGLPAGSGEPSNVAKFQPLPVPAAGPTWTATLTLN